MIDMHCHILPNVDDGSKSIDMSVEMARKAYKLGYTGIFATSHFIENSHEIQIDEVEKKTKQLMDKLKENGINMDIYVGNEVYYTPNVVSILKENKKISRLNNSRYFLIEFPMSGSVMNFTSEIVGMVEAGFRPVIAHPERYEFTSKNFEILKQAIELGALLQLNITSVAGMYGSIPKKNAIKLLKNNMIHLMGTDSHNDEKVYKYFDKSIKKISKIIGKEKLHEILYDNSAKIRDNENFVPEFI